MKRLVKGKDKMISGVCSGIADYLGIDPTIVRLIWAAFACFAGSGVIAYIIAAVIMPDAL